MMSYCRFSSDFGECDVYVYEDVMGGWTTHVAGSRLKHVLPDEIKAMYAGWQKDKENGVERFMAAERARKQWLMEFPGELLPTKTVDGEPGEGIWSVDDSEYLDLSEISEYAGHSFNDATPGECADRLEKIRASGLNVPDYAIEALREEEADVNS